MTLTRDSLDRSKWNLDVQTLLIVYFAPKSGLGLSGSSGDER
jgi:hypothetical protein